MEDINRYWYCITTEGELCVLGDHGDIEAADDTARDLGIDCVWLFDHETAMAWRDIINQVHFSNAEDDI